MLVITGKYGELCNRIFTFANIIAFAAENGLTVINSAFDEYAPYVASSRGDALCRYPARSERGEGSRRLRYLFFRIMRRLMRVCDSSGLFTSLRVGEQGTFFFDDSRNSETVRHLKEGSLAFCDGLYFLDSPNFVKHADLIRDFFSPVEPVQERVTAHMKTVRNGAEVMVGVHIRQGDYKQFQNGLFYYTTEEYARFMGRIAALFPMRVVRFLLCSNEKQEMGVFRGLDVAAGPGHFIEDLYALARCDYIIGPPSTFSQWASFYGQVPRYMINYKAAGHHGLQISDPQLNDFIVHTSGFGKHVPPSAS